MDITTVSNGVIIVTVGLPGAGKSTLCRALVQELSKDTSIIYRYVCYDDILNDRTSWNQVDYCWKSERRSLFEDISSWLHINLNEITQESASGFKRSIWLIIDDNMYYRSMRYPYYQLAREYHMGYAQLYFTCSISNAINRNQIRSISERIPSTVIERMHARMQAPSMEWEKYSITVDTDTESAESVVPKLLKELRIASEIPAPQLTKVDLEEKEKQRQLSKDSLLHQTDLALRRIVSEYHKSQNTSTNGQGMKKYSNQALCHVKRRLLEDARSGRLDMSAIIQDIDTLRVIFDDSLENSHAPSDVQGMS